MTGESGTARVLLTGATGFVGRHLWSELVASGYFVRCMTRDVTRARLRWPERDWVEADVLDEARIAEAVKGCDAAFYLVHGMAADSPDFRLRELRAAHRFVSAAASAGLERLVYLSSLPGARLSEHMKSRQEVGDLLRRGARTLELRAGFIIGHGGAYWNAWRSAVTRTPVLPAPAWLFARLRPISVDDLVAALVAGLDVPLPLSEGFDLVGPDTITGRDLISEVARAVGRRTPVFLNLEGEHLEGAARFVSWAARVDRSLARELVLQLSRDRASHEDRYWQLAGHTRLVGAAEAVRRAVMAEAAGPWSGIASSLSASSARPWA